jgi:hypothetical protein
MRIPSTTGDVYPYPIEGANALEDMQVLYPGDITTFSPTDFPPDGMKQLESSEKLVIANCFGSEPAITNLRLLKLEQPAQAKRWTAAQAYRAKQGRDVSRIALEEPGLRLYQEYTARLAQNDPALTAVAESYQVTTAIASGQSSWERARAQIAEANRDAREAYTENPNLQLELMDREFQRRSEAIRHLPVPLEAPPSVSIIHAEVDDIADLPGSAMHLASNYYGMLSRPLDQEPEHIVAHAFGAVSLTELKIVWGRALEQNSPLAAGQFIMSQLVSPA